MRGTGWATGWALGSVALVSAAQLLMKWGMAQLPPVAAFLTITHSPIWNADVMALAAIVVGIVFYALSMLCWLKVLHALPLGRAYPLLSISYVLVAVATVVLPCFNEPIHWLKIAGIALVLAGVWFIHSEGEKR